MDIDYSYNDVINNPEEVEQILKKLIGKDLWIRCHVKPVPKNFCIWIRPRRFESNFPDIRVPDHRVFYNYVDEHFMYDPESIDSDDYEPIYFNQRQSWNWLGYLEIIQPTDVITTDEMLAYIGDWI